MSRNEHGAYGPRYEASSDARLAGGESAPPPHTGTEHPMATAPHVQRGVGSAPAPTPSVPVLLTLLSVLLGALAMIWPLYEIRLTEGPSAVTAVVTSHWIHGATSTVAGPGAEAAGQARPMGLVLYILLMLGAIAASIVAWRGRSVRSEALGLLGVAIFAGAMIVPSLMAVTAEVGVPDSAIEVAGGAGLWLGLASAVSALVAAALYYSQLGRRTPRSVHD